MRNVPTDSNLLKHLNKRKVLHYIQRKDGHSRSDIAKALKLSKPTVSNIVDELLEEGWIREKESERASSAGGRKPFQIFFNENAAYIVGIDIGGTLVEMAIMNLAGKIISKTAFSTQKHVGSNFIQSIADYVNTLIEQEGLESSMLFGVGVGVPGITDVDSGIVIDAPSLSWKNIPLQSQLESHLSCPVYIDNDVNVAALGEYWKGAGKKNNNMIMITLGTGIGCGIIINGQLYRGASYAAGEIGYMVTDKDAADKKYEQTFRGYGFLDSHVGGPSIAKRMLQHSQKSEEKWTAKKVFQMAIDGDQIALKTVNDSLSHLSFALINVISIINPEKVVLGGGISKSMNHFLPYLTSNLEKHLPVQTDITITTVEDVSLLGAGYLILKEHESILKV
ncbi:ROK family transcriptional regulator [Oceanobacillus profundus]|uniref:ROK family transcriptional regulator n=1 Tax=Oceanobacillus TaxID=182709 RepID=UPI003AFFE5E5